MESGGQRVGTGYRMLTGQLHHVANGTDGAEAGLAGGGAAATAPAEPFKNWRRSMPVFSARRFRAVTVQGSRARRNAPRRALGSDRR